MSSRSAWEACIQGGMKQSSTDHRREHRERPTAPGQSFSLDAYANSVKSSTGNKHTDIFVDHYSRRYYPVHTKDRSSAEICAKADILFNSHPEWKDTGEPSKRTIRLDPENNYSSVEFLAFAHKHGYKLEHTPPRDKHAGGIAERSVGIVALKANTAMLATTPAVPLSYWDYAITYACDTLSFCFSKAIGTSPYHLLTGQHVNLRHLQAFWTPCYVHVPLKNEGASSYAGAALTKEVYQRPLQSPKSKLSTTPSKLR